MDHSAILTNWQPRHAVLWNEVPLLLSHRLHQSELFSNERLGRLIDAYPRDAYSVVEWGEHDGKRGLWREGDIGDLKGVEVIDAVAEARVWINLRDTAKFDPDYAALLDQIFAEFGARIPGFETHRRRMGILISSPNSRTLYHADLPGQGLWQMRGQKRVYLYPNAKPFMTPAYLEGISLTGVEASIPFEPWYDDHARIIDLEPGQMVHWPLHMPHRVDNADCLNVSMTLEYWTDEISRVNTMNLANGILRHKIGWTPKSRAISGPGFLAKTVLQRALRNTKWVKKENRAHPPASFSLKRASRPGAADAGLPVAAE